MPCWPWPKPPTAAACGCWLLWRSLHALRQLRQLPEPARRVDGTDAARKLLSTIYRVHQASGIGLRCGAHHGHTARQKTDKVAQFGHDKISTFGMGADLTEPQLRGVLRQLIATGAVGLQR